LLAEEVWQNNPVTMLQDFYTDICQLMERGKIIAPELEIY
jgi:hypothetical protein